MKRLLLWMVFAFIPLAAFAQEETLTIDQCVDVALKRNNELVQSNIQLKIYSRDEISALSRFLPSVNASLDYRHSVFGPSSELRIDPTTGIPTPIYSKRVQWNSSLDFSARQMLFDGSSIFNFVRAKYTKDGATSTYDYTLQNTIYMVKSAYFDLLKKEKLLQAQEETLKQWEESYKRIDMMYQVGKVAKSDVLKAKVQLENARLALLQAQNDLSIANAQLNYELGFSVDRKVKAVDLQVSPSVDIPYETALEKATANNPQLKKSQADVSASKAGVYSSSSSFLPSIYASGGYSWSNRRLNQIKNMFDTDYGWSMGVTLSIPIFQGFSRIADVSKSKLSLKSSREMLEQTRRDVALTVKQAYNAVQLVKQQITVTQDAEAAAEEDLRLNREKYELGSGTMLELITSQAAYTTAKNNRIQAVYDYQTVFAQLQKAMGVLK
jgi:TolC family type I secretion outer membrane protein